VFSWLEAEIHCMSKNSVLIHIPPQVNTKNELQTTAENPIQNNYNKRRTRINLTKTLDIIGLN
jgi:hypothetical protein